MCRGIESEVLVLEFEEWWWWGLYCGGGEKEL